MKKKLLGVFIVFLLLTIAFSGCLNGSGETGIEVKSWEVIPGKYDRYNSVDGQYVFSIPILRISIFVSHTNGAITYLKKNEQNLVTYNFREGEEQTFDVYLDEVGKTSIGYSSWHPSGPLLDDEKVYGEYIIQAFDREAFYKIDPKPLFTDSFSITADQPLYDDSDGDGVKDNNDPFPNDSNEYKDGDGDGVGDNSDEFPYDSNKMYRLEITDFPTDKIDYLCYRGCQLYDFSIIVKNNGRAPVTFTGDPDNRCCEIEFKDDKSHYDWGSSNLFPSKSKFYNIVIQPGEEKELKFTFTSYTLSENLKAPYICEGDLLNIYLLNSKGNIEASYSPPPLPALD